MDAEHRVQNAIRNALAGECLLFRANVGRAWTGDAYLRLPNGDLLIVNPRPFDTGLPAGFSDLFALVPEVVTPDMVGTTVGIFGAVEVKSKTGRVGDKQSRFLKAVNDNGGRAGVARSVDDARGIIHARNRLHP